MRSALRALAVVLVGVMVGPAWSQSLLGPAEAIQALRALVGTPPDPGTNTLIVSHKPNIIDAFGKEWFEIREGEASIFKPEGGGKYSLVSRVQIGQWTGSR
jgi:hypothetical protein